MYFLGTDYIVSSLLWLTLIAVLVFTFRKHLFKHYYPNTSFDLFLSKLKTYLEKNYPLIKYDFTIIKTSESERNPELRKSIIISNIIDQYRVLKLDKSKLPLSTPSELHSWTGYVFNCEPNRDKLPPDWGKRKNAILLRDKAKCLRCSKHITINTVAVHMIRTLKDGGKYHLENLFSVCKDCEIILTKNTKKMTQLAIIHDLNEIAEKS